MEVIYQGGKVGNDLYDLEIFKNKHIYTMSIESIIEYKDVGNLKRYYLKLLKGCKEYLEEQYKLKDNEYQQDCGLEYEIYYNEKFKLFSIGFNEYEFFKLEELYLWICKVIRQVSSIKQYIEGYKINKRGMRV